MTWTPQRRFDRAFERLSFLPRAARYEFLVLAARLGLADIEPSTLQLAAAGATDPVALAAKRVFGIGDVANFARRTTDLVAETDDLLLRRWISRCRTGCASRATGSRRRAPRLRRMSSARRSPARSACRWRLQTCSRPFAGRLAWAIDRHLSVVPARVSR